MATFDWNKRLEDYLKDIGYYDQYKAAEDYRVNNDPGKYQSAYQKQIGDTMGSIANRQPFKYDPNSDALYQQYKNQYTALGKRAMQDTIGQASALTGGYANSYAQSVGQQAYQGYMDQLAGKIPELYQLRRSEYDADTANLYKMLAMYQDADATDYGKYRDTVSDYQNMLNYYTGRADTAYNRGASQYGTDYANAFDLYRAQAADEQDARDFAESVRQYNEKMAYQREQDAIANELAWYKANSSGGGSGGSGGSGSGGNNSSDETVTEYYMLSDTSRDSIKKDYEKISGSKINEGNYDKDVEDIVEKWMKKGYDEDSIRDYIAELAKQKEKANRSNYALYQ